MLEREVYQTKRLISVIVCIAFIAVIIVMFILYISGINLESNAAVMALIVILGGKFSSVVDYWIGSSASSVAANQALIDQAVAAIAMREPSNIVIDDEEIK